MTKSKARLGPALLRRINEQRVLEQLHIHGPASRARLRRITGLTAPTISKVVDGLLGNRLLEELEPTEPGVGRPGKLLRLAQTSAVVLGVLLDADRCVVTAAGMDGRISPVNTRHFLPPASYAGLIDSLEHTCREVLDGLAGLPQGAAVVVNGLLNQAGSRVICAANLHILDGQDPAGDLAARLGFRCRLFKGTSALCFSERASGGLADRDNFAVLDMTTGLGLGAIANGILITGHSGMGGEIGHVVVQPEGVLCGCGNRGCLETLATDAALIRLISEQLGSPQSRAEVRRLLIDHPHKVSDSVETVARHLAMAAAMVVTMLNSQTILIHSELFLDAPGNLEAVSGWLDRLGLQASVKDCSLKKTVVSKEHAAVAGIIHDITRTLLVGPPTG
jgi:predicted NBD/HSP70 family sugar kinase